MSATNQTQTSNTAAATAVADDHIPLVSIGLAVFNGEKYLHEAIDSILAQTFTDFELIISDNASTDSTPEICAEYAARDSRIRYHRNATNIGGANNENQTFRMSRGKYFRWAAHDDVLAPTLLERCVEVMERDPEVVLCHPWTVVIDENGVETGRVARNRPRSLQGWKLFADLAQSGSNCEETYGLMRSDSLRSTGLQRNYTDSDRTLLAHMALLGRYREIGEFLFYKRIHPQNSTSVYKDWRGRMRWFGPKYESGLRLPHWQQFIHYLTLIQSSPVPLSTKVRCWAYMPVWVASNRKWRSLGKDVALASAALVGRSAAVTRSRLGRSQQTLTP